MQAKEVILGGKDAGRIQQGVLYSFKEYAPKLNTGECMDANDEFADEVDDITDLPRRRSKTIFDKKEKKSRIS